MVDEAEVEGGTPAVPGDLEHVVLGRVDGPAAHPVGTLGQLSHVIGKGVTAGDNDGLGPSPDDRRDGKVQVGGSADVGDLAPQAHELGDVAEAGEACGEAPRGAVRRKLEGGDGAAEVGSPRVEGPETDGFEDVGLEVGLHDPQLGHGVGDRRRGGEGDDPWPVAVAQHPELGVEVLGALGALVGHALDRRCHPPVLVEMTFIHEEVVNPRLLEADAVILSVTGLERAKPFLLRGDVPLESLDGQ